MKQVAFLEYSFIFDPSEAWSNGYQFENQLAEFFGAYGFEAQIVATTGGTGRRVIFLKKVEAIATPEPKQVEREANTDIKRVQTQAPTKSFKEYQTRGVPTNIVNQEKRAPKLGYNMPGRILRKKVRMP